MTKSDIKLAHLWITNQITLREIKEKKGLNHENDVYRFLANCYKYEKKAK